MEEVDESAEWLACAASNLVLVAHELICLSRPSARVPWRSLLRRSPPPGDEPAFSLLAPPAWLNRGPRSRKSRRISGGAKAEEDDEAAERERARGSPATPLEFPAGSDASSSGGEEGSICVADVAAAAGARCSRPSERGMKVVSRKLEPVVSRIPEARPPIRRPGKRKTVRELRASEKSLLEARMLLQKELESRRREREELMEEKERLNRLKFSLQSKSALPISLFKETESKEHQMKVLLPDLNEPWLEDF